MGSLARAASFLLRSSAFLTPTRLVAVGLPASLAGFAAASTGDPLAAMQITKNVPLRLARDVWTAAAIVADYKRTLGQTAPDDPDYEDAKHACHLRSAQRLVSLCFANGGIYIKLGQHIGQLDHLLPDEYVHTMRTHLLDRCPVSDEHEVRRIIEHDLGQPVESLYSTFNWEPIASASLAQVHEAYTHDGQHVAVKVQHEGLRESSVADIATIEALVSIVKWVFPTFDYMWLVEETKLNLPKELDFLHEAANSQRCIDNLQSSRSHVRGKVIVPAVMLTMSSPRVLTMDFVQGVKVTDIRALEQLGIAPHRVAQLVSQTFNEMIFTHGDVHCDPHAANMLIRRVPSSHQRPHQRPVWWPLSQQAGPLPGQWQLVLLDHGLYRQIDDTIRHHYAGLWMSLIFGDVEGIKTHAAGLNAGDAYVLFAAMLTARPWDEIVQQRADKLHIPRTDANKKRIQGYAAQFAQEITQLLLRMPRPLLLLLKTNDCLRSVDYALGQPINTFTIVARECSRALAEERALHVGGLRPRLVSLEERVGVEFRVLVLQKLAKASSRSVEAQPPSKMVVRYSVFELAERASNGRGSVQANVLSFWRLHAADQSSTLEDVWTCIQHALMHPQKCVQVTRFFAFITAIASNTEDNRMDECRNLITTLLQRLLPLTMLAQPLPRLRACQLVGALMKTDCIEQLHDAHAALLKRVRDKVPAVREQAVVALASIAASEGKGVDAPTVAGLCTLLRTERNKAVRVAIIQTLPCTADTLPLLLERTLDVSEDVRAAVYTRLHVLRVLPTDMSMEQRISLLHRGLCDRASHVHSAAATLATAWIGGCAGNVLHLLALLDVQQQPDTCASIIKALLQHGLVSMQWLTQHACVVHEGLVGDDTNVLLQPHVTLFWRVVCDVLAGEAAGHSATAARAVGAHAQLEAAAAAEGLEVLEHILPDSGTTTLERLQAHIHGVEETHGREETQFAACQLLLLAQRHVDMADATCRTAAQVTTHDALHTLLHTPPTPPTLLLRWTDAVGVLLATAADTPAQRAALVAGVLGDGMVVGGGGDDAGVTAIATTENATGILAVLCALLLHVDSRAVLTGQVCGPHGNLDAVLHAACGVGMDDHAPQATRLMATRCMGLYSCLHCDAPVYYLQHLVHLLHNCTTSTTHDTIHGTRNNNSSSSGGGRNTTSNRNTTHKAKGRKKAEIIAQEEEEQCQEKEGESLHALIVGQAAQALCDIACIRGPGALAHALPHNNTPPQTTTIPAAAVLSMLMTSLYHSLPSNNNNTSTTPTAVYLTEGIIKLLTLTASHAWGPSPSSPHHVPLSLQAALLSQLLALQFDSSVCGGDVEVVQAIAAWSGRCAHAGGLPLALLTQCIVPCARQVVAGGGGSAAAGKARVDRAIRFVLQLIQYAATPRDTYTPTPTWQPHALAVVLVSLVRTRPLLEEGLPATSSKTLVACLCKAAESIAQLHTSLSHAQAQLLVGLCRAAMQVIHERVPVKHLAAVEAAVADVCTQHVVGWTMDELQATDEWAQLVITVDEIRAAQSTLLAGVEDGSQREGGRGGPRKRAASKLPVVLDDDTSDTETSEEEEEDDDGSSEDEQEEETPIVVLQQKQRHTRASRVVVEEDEEAQENLSSKRATSVDTSPLRHALRNTQLG